MSESTQQRCTWEGCTQGAIHQQRDRDGNVWADLCREHHEKLDSAIGVDAAKMLGYWIKAQGGAKKAAERMMQ